MKGVIIAVTLVAASAAHVLADSIPYPQIGTVAPTTTFTAASDGHIFAYFYGSSAVNDDNVTLFVNGVELGTGVPNHNDTIGAVFDLGAVIEGDDLVFVLNNRTTHALFSSDPAQSADGLNHVYATNFSGGNGVPPGTYLGFEDLAASDFDYNDDSLVFTNVAAQTSPEPLSLLLTASGVSVTALIRRRRRHIRS